MSALSVGATLAAAGIGLTWHHERDQAEAVRELTHEVAALRAQLATSSSASAAPAPSSTLCADSADAGSASFATRARVPPSLSSPLAASAPVGSGAPLPASDPRLGDGGGPQTPAQAAALASATDLVDAALRRGTISRAEMSILRARIDAAGRSEESEALRAEIADAIDQGVVVAERPAPVWH